MLTFVDSGMGSISGRIIALDQECGKEQMVERPSPLVAVTIIKPLLTLRYKNIGICKKYIKKSSFSSSWWVINFHSVAL